MKRNYSKNSVYVTPLTPQEVDLFDMVMIRKLNFETQINLKHTQLQNAIGKEEHA